MNKWLYRAVGTVGVASGFLLFAGGMAQADETDAAQPAVDPQQLRGMLDDLFTPTAGAPLPGGAAAGPTDVLSNDVFVNGPVRDLLRGLPMTPPPAARTLPAPAEAAPAGGHALPVTGVDPANGVGLLDALPLHSTDTSLPVRGSHLNAEPAAGMLPPGVVPAGLRPAVQTGTVGTELPLLGPLRLDSANGRAKVPAVIGDTMAAQRADLFDLDEPDAEQTPVLGSLPVLGGLTRASSPAALPALAGALPAALPAGAASMLPVGDLASTLPAPAAPPAGRHALRPGSTTQLRPTPRPALAGQPVAQPGRHAAEAPVRRVLGSPGGRAAERPVAGEDADFS